jgi:hypothetical protein
MKAGPETDLPSPIPASASGKVKLPAHGAGRRGKERTKHDCALEHLRKGINHPHLCPLPEKEGDRPPPPPGALHLPVKRAGERFMSTSFPCREATLCAASLPPPAGGGELRKRVPMGRGRLRNGVSRGRPRSTTPESRIHRPISQRIRRKTKCRQGFLLWRHFV